MRRCLPRDDQLVAVILQPGAVKHCRRRRVQGDDVKMMLEDVNLKIITVSSAHLHLTHFALVDTEVKCFTC